MQSFKLFFLTTKTNSLPIVLKIDLTNLLFHYSSKVAWLIYATKFIFTDEQGFVLMEVCEDYSPLCVAMMVNVLE